MSLSVTTGKINFKNLHYIKRRELIIFDIQNGVPVPEIAEKYGVNKRTIYRDLHVLGVDLKKKFSEFAEISFLNFVKRFEKIRDRLEDQYAKADSEDDYSTNLLDEGQKK